jgi:hypothetical protein
MMARQVRPTLSKPVTPIGLYEVALMIRRKRADSIRARGTEVSYTGRIYGRNPDLLVANIDEIILQTGMGPYMGDPELELKVPHPGPRTRVFDKLVFDKLTSPAVLFSLAKKGV